MNIKKVGIGIAIVVVVIVIVSSLTMLQTSTPSEQRVTVGGLVTTTGLGTLPLRVDFDNNGEKVSATIDSDNRYSIELDAPASYKVTVAYSASGLTTGICDGGTLNLKTTPDARPYDIKC